MKNIRPEKAHDVNAFCQIIEKLKGFAGSASRHDPDYRRYGADQ